MAAGPAEPGAPVAPWEAGMALAAPGQSSWRKCPDRAPDADGVVAGAEGAGGTAGVAGAEAVDGVGWSARACATANSGTAIVARRITQCFIRSTSFIR